MRHKLSAHRPPNRNRRAALLKWLPFPTAGWARYIFGDARIYRQGEPLMKIKLATGVVILPQRNPLYVAKEIATLDLLSGGRVILGIGSGWLKEEFDALGLDFRTRAAPDASATDSSPRSARSRSSRSFSE